MYMLISDDESKSNVEFQSERANRKSAWSQCSESQSSSIGSSGQLNKGAEDDSPNSCEIHDIIGEDDYSLEALYDDQRQIDDDEQMYDEDEQLLLTDSTQRLFVRDVEPANSAVSPEPSNKEQAVYELKQFKKPDLSIVLDGQMLNYVSAQDRFWRLGQTTKLQTWLCETIYEKTGHLFKMLRVKPGFKLEDSDLPVTVDAFPDCEMGYEKSISSAITLSSDAAHTAITRKNKNQTLSTTGCSDADQTQKCEDFEYQFERTSQVELGYDEEVVQDETSITDHHDVEDRTERESVEAADDSSSSSCPCSVKGEQQQQKQLHKEGSSSVRSTTPAEAILTNAPIVTPPPTTTTTTTTTTARSDESVIKSRSSSRSSRLTPLLTRGEAGGAGGAGGAGEAGGAGRARERAQQSAKRYQQTHWSSTTPPSDPFLEHGSHDKYHDYQSKNFVVRGRHGSRHSSRQVSDQRQDNNPQDAHYYSASGGGDGRQHSTAELTFYRGPHRPRRSYNGRFPRKIGHQPHSSSSSLSNWNFPASASSSGGGGGDGGHISQRSRNLLHSLNQQCGYFKTTRQQNNDDYYSPNSKRSQQQWHDNNRYHRDATFANAAAVQRAGTSALEQANTPNKIRGRGHGMGRPNDSTPHGYRSNRNQRRISYFYC